MTVFVVYPRGSRAGLRVFRFRRDAEAFIAKQEWPGTWILHQRRVL